MAVDDGSGRVIALHCSMRVSFFANRIPFWLKCVSCRKECKKRNSYRADKRVTKGKIRLCRSYSYCVTTPVQFYHTYTIWFGFT